MKDAAVPVVADAKDNRPGKSTKSKASAGAEKAPVTLKPATASREDNLSYDLKHLAAFDIAPLQPQVNLTEYTRDSVQLLVNRIFSLPTSTSQEGLVANLPPAAVFMLPRQKPIPKEKPKTRWQKFMEERNMRKRKRSRLVFDEASGDWKPRWGYKSAKKEQEKAQWIHEVKDGENPLENPFDKKAAEKKLLMARQKMREVRNKVEAAGGKLRASTPDLTFGGAKRGKDGLREALKRAQVSSASHGKFDRVAPNEPTNIQPKKRRAADVQSAGEEKARYLKAATRLLSGDGSVDKNKAAKLGASHSNEDQRAKGGGKGNKAAPKRRSKQGGRKGKR